MVCTTLFGDWVRGNVGFNFSGLSLTLRTSPVVNSLSDALGGEVHQCSKPEDERVGRGEDRLRDHSPRKLALRGCDASGPPFCKFCLRVARPVVVSWHFRASEANP